MVQEVRSETRREEICAVATRLFYASGFHATSTRDIAAQLSIQMPTLYYYFSSKGELLFEIMSSVLKRLIDRCKRRLSGISDPQERLREAVRFHVCFHCEFAEEATIVDTELRALSEENRIKVKTLRDKYEEIFQGILYEGMESGVFDVPDVKIASYALLSMATGVIGWYRPNGRFTPEEIADIYGALAVKEVSRKL